MHAGGTDGVEGWERACRCLPVAVVIKTMSGRKVESQSDVSKARIGWDALFASTMYGNVKDRRRSD